MAAMLFSSDNLFLSLPISSLPFHLFNLTGTMSLHCGRPLPQLLKSYRHLMSPYWAGVKRTFKQAHWWPHWVLPLAPLRNCTMTYRLIIWTKWTLTECVYVCVYVCMCVPMCMCVYCVYVCVCVCVCVCLLQTCNRDCSHNRKK